MEGTMPSFDIDPNQPLPQPQPEEKWRVTKFEAPDHKRFDAAIAISPNGRRVVRLRVRGFVSADFLDFGLSLQLLMPGDELQLREVETVASGHPQNARISAIKFGPDGKTLATGGGDGSVCVWNLFNIGKTWKPRATIQAGKLTVSCLAFSPDGKTLVAGTLNRGRASKTGTDNLLLIDAATGKQVASYRLHDAVRSLAFSPDGKTLVTGHNLGRVQAWNVDDLLKTK